MAQGQLFSRREFLASASLNAGATLVHPRLLFGEDLGAGLVQQIRSEAANAKITVQPLRRNISILMDSGGNIAVLPGRDGKLLIDAIDGMIRATEANLAKVTDKMIVIPGHGPAGDKSQLTFYRDLLVTVRDKVAALKKQGGSLDEIVAAKPTAAWDARWGGGFRWLYEPKYVYRPGFRGGLTSMTQKKTVVCNLLGKGWAMDRLNDDVLDVLFRRARTHNAWLPKPVPDELLRELYAVVKWGPTSANSCPARFVFLRSAAAKDRLRPALAAGNVEKTMAAPVTVIIAYDLKFYEKLPKLFPHNPAMRDHFANNPQLVEQTAKRNSSLQGAYLMLAARALGLDCGPMSGFDNAKVDQEFFAAGKCEDCGEEFFPAGHVKSNFLCNIGYGDSAKLFPRSPRLDFSEACSLM